jgi:hypothetical protein
MVLVYLKEPFGVLYIGNYKVYGYCTNMPPVEVDYATYEADRLGDQRFKSATYREGYLSKLFGRPFSRCAFTYGGLRHLPEKTLDRIAKEMGVVDYDSKANLNSKVRKIKYCLRMATEG